LLAAAILGLHPSGVGGSGLAVLFIAVAASVTALILLRWGHLVAGAREDGRADARPTLAFPLLGPVTAAMVGMVALAMAIHTALPESTPRGPMTIVTVLHVAATLVGYLLFAPAFVLGNLYVGQTWRLKTKQPSSTRLPALGTLEKSAWRLLTVGFVLYTVGIVGGWLSSGGAERALRPQHVVAALAWFVYAVALTRRYAFGWRGVRAAIALMAGFVVTSGAVLLYLIR
jgi:ABC-type uncharacterized transport system permease subunit